MPPLDDASRVALRTLDVLDAAVLVCRLDGTEHHRTPAFGALLQNEPERDRLVAALRASARLLAPGLRRPLPPPAERALRTPTARYRLRTAFLPPDILPPDGAVLLTLDRDEAGPRLPGPDALRRRYGLSRREAEVALLLAEGLSNEALAERLFISPHTARRHTEHVLGKMALHSRKALALKLLQEVAPVPA